MFLCGYFTGAKMMQVGDSLVFTNMLSANRNDWNMNAEQFSRLKEMLGKICAITYIQKHYEDNGSKTFYLNVEFQCGFKLKSANSIQFEVLLH